MKTLVILVWVLMGVFYWWMFGMTQLECCGSGSMIMQQADGPHSEESVLPEFPVAFEYSSYRPRFGKDFDRYADSLTASLEDDDKMVITGLFGPDEVNSSDAEDLGVARSRAFAEYMDNRISRDRLVLRSEETDPLDRTVRWFDLLRFNTEKMPESIVEIEDRTLIYFPYNSTRRLESREIESYLSAVAERVKGSGEIVYLTGHTDSYGNASYNYNLGLWRARKIRDVLIRMGLPSSQVVVESMGEVSPIAPNNTEDGRSKNRRTELVIKEP